MDKANQTGAVERGSQKYKSLLYEEIELCREALEKRVNRLGVEHPEVVQFSQLLDGLIVEAQFGKPKKK